MEHFQWVFLQLGFFSQFLLPFGSPVFDQCFTLLAYLGCFGFCISVNVTREDRALACGGEQSIKEIESTTSPHTPGIVHLPPLAVGGTFSIVWSISCPPGNWFLFQPLSASKIGSTSWLFNEASSASPTLAPYWLVLLWKCRILKCLQSKVSEGDRNWPGKENFLNVYCTLKRI